MCDLSGVTLHPLQHLQNSLARVVLPFTKRYDHITPALKTLHWLPIKQRIHFKIATLTFKTLQNKQPSYLNDLLLRHNPTHSLRSSNQNLLVIPRIDSENGRRSFKFAAPSIWNSLPQSIRSLENLTIFHSSLKTHPFPAVTGFFVISLLSAYFDLRSHTGFSSNMV